MNLTTMGNEELVDSLIWNYAESIRDCSVLSFDSTLYEKRYEELKTELLRRLEIGERAVAVMEKIRALFDSDLFEYYPRQKVLDNIISFLRDWEAGK
jgi:hypothetical protein